MQTEHSDINTQDIEAELNARLIGSKIIYIESVDSTNNYLKRSGCSGNADGTVVVARKQTAGRGRLGRRWYAEDGECLMFSFLLTPDIPTDRISTVTLLSGLSVCSALRDRFGIDCRIKWPNDIIVGSRKLCGILTESMVDLSGKLCTVTGIGINALQSSFEPEIAHKATSLYLLTGKKPDMNELLCRVLEYLDRYLADSKLLLNGKFLDNYTKLCDTLGRKVSFERDGRELCGRAVGINSSGCLEVSLFDGGTVAVGSGEVTVQGIY